MKRTKQVGGGKLYTLSMGDIGDAAGKARALKLFAKLEASNIEAIKTNLIYWFSTKRGSRVDENDIQSIVNNYFAGIEHQDELFDIVAEILTETYGTQDIIQDSEDINKYKAEAMKYIDDVRQFILFKYPPESAVNPFEEAAKPELTKLEIIKGRTETLSELLIFPKRLTNVFIQSLANIFILFKNNRDILTQIKTPGLMSIAVSEYTANLYSNVWHLTAHEFRDGFFLDQGEDDFKATMGTFWKELFDNLANIEELGTKDIELIKDTTTWAHIAAYVFKWYLTYQFDDVKDHKESLLTYFKSIAKQDPTRTITGTNTEGMRAALPPANCDEFKMFGTTIKELMTFMDSTTLEFILHLAYTIRKNEASTVAEITAASGAK